MTEHTLTWTELQNELKTLRGKINYSPDVIVGIARGGLIPARLLSTHLSVKDMFCLAVKKIGDRRKVTVTIDEDINGKNILLVEDMLETGRSLIIAKQYLEERGANVKTACLYIMPASEITPDYYLKEVDRAVKFPWE